MSRSLPSHILAAALVAVGISAFIPAAQAQEVRFKPYKGTGIYTYTVKGKFEDLLASLRTSLEARQFTIVGVSDLASPLELNKELFREHNKLGYDQVRSLSICSIELNHEALNTDLNLAALCPFKIALYSKKGSDEVTFAFISAEAMLAGSKDPKLIALSRKADQRIKQAVEGVLP
jgi:uncharacterized protein (DUF302 family)